MTNFKMKKWVNVHKKSISYDKVNITPSEMSEINRDADEIFAALDVNKVNIIFYSKIKIGDYYKNIIIMCCAGWTSVKKRIFRERE